MTIPVLVTLLILPLHQAAPVERPAVESHVSLTGFPSRVGHDFVRLGKREPLLTFAIGGVAAAAVHPADVAVTNAIAGSPGADTALDAGATGGNGFAQFAAAGAVYAIGRATGSVRTQEVGSALLEAQTVGGLITQGLKHAVNRQRPNGGRYSFPSGHSSSVFATAEVLRRHFGWKVGLAAYAGAAYVATSRLSEREHYLSDVVFGAAIGIAAGSTPLFRH
jgi:membrane-associated phospholipid phosphatase